MARIFHWNTSNIVELPRAQLVTANIHRPDIIDAAVTAFVQGHNDQTTTIDRGLHGDRDCAPRNQDRAVCAKVYIVV